MAEVAGDSHMLGQILVGRIGTLMVMGDHRVGDILIPQASAILRAHGDDDYLRRLYINIGSGHYHRERYQDAYDAYAEAIRLMDAAGQRDHIWASLMMNHGIACTQLSLIEEATECFRRAEDYGRASKRELLVAQAQFNLGAMEALRGDYRSALRLLVNAEATLSRLGARDLLAACCLELAQLHLEIGMPAEARELAGRAESSFLGEEMLLDAQLARLAQAMSLLKLKRPDEAIELLTEMEGFYRARDLGASLARIHLELAAALIARGDLPAAEDRAGKSLRIARQQRFQVLGASARCVLAEVALARNELPRARRVLRPLKAAVARLPVQARLDYWMAAARLAKAEGRWPDAIGGYSRAVDCVEAKRSLIPGFELRARSFDRDVFAYLEKIDILTEIPGTRADSLFDLMESARGRAFRELPGSAAVSDRERLRKERAKLASMVRRLETSEMSPTPTSRRNADRLRRRIRVLERQISTGLAEIEARPSTTARRKTHMASKLAGLLDAHELLIEYFVTENKIIVANVSTRARSIRVLGTHPSTIREILERLQLQLTAFAASVGAGYLEPDLMRSQADVCLRRLYELLIGPILEVSPPCARLIIVPHGFLHAVPFECTLDGDLYLNDSHEVLRCPTAEFLIERRSTSGSAREGQVVVVAGSHESSPMIEPEARRIAAIWASHAVQLMIDPEPDQALMAVASARLVHISAHGSFRADNPLFSTLHLGGGKMFLADLLGLRSSAELVVLSACSSGEVLSGPGDSLFGVAHAFLAGGSRHLVAAPHRIHDRSTADWMDRFHLSYRECGNPVAAARDARRACRKEWPHPFHWGLFCCLGT